MMADPMAVILILALGVATYGTRIAGHLVLSRFERLNPHVEAALDAVPIAVITALVAPAVLARSYADAIAAALTIVAALKLPILPTLVIGAATVSVLRAAGL
jgi:uncharacterized membrane protein